MWDWDMHDVGRPGEAVAAAACSNPWLMQVTDIS